MRVLVCPTAFKGSIGAAEAADAMARGVRRAAPGADVRAVPLSDGGPGLLDAVRAADVDAPVETIEVSGPLGRPAAARILWTRPEALPGGVAGGGDEGDGSRPQAEDGEAGGRPRGSVNEPVAPAAADRRSDGGEGARHGNGAGDAPREVAVLESADACGIHLVAEDERDALRAHTRGVGEMIRAAVSRGAARVLVGLGGSATTDGGTGMARAFGYRFLDGEGRELPEGGGALPRLERIEPGRPPSVPVTGLADVTTSMSGASGAARTFGPQKGATAEELEALVAGLERLADRLERDLGLGGAGDRPGSGAAGGLGAGLAAFLGADLVPGADWVLEATGVAGGIADAGLVVTGEGAFDATSAEGKITGRVLELARRAEVPAVLVCGRVCGEPPEGVRALDGGGRRLEPGDVADLAARAVEDGAGGR